MLENRPDVTPFEIHVSEDALVDLSERLRRTRWIEDLADGSWDRGPSIPYLRGLVDHWIEDFDWRARESAINRLPQFRTTIKGTGLHFIHQRGHKGLSTPPREWAERFFDVQRWSEMPRGAHFAALEEPDLLVNEIRAFFRSLRHTRSSTRGRSDVVAG
jgi:hypothetical protein